jgi:hypothetical protein
VGNITFPLSSAVMEKWRHDLTAKFVKFNVNVVASDNSATPVFRATNSSANVAMIAVPPRTLATSIAAQSSAMKSLSAALLARDCFAPP